MPKPISSVLIIGEESAGLLTALALNDSVSTTACSAAIFREPAR
jgi:hypothetical protein